MKEQNIVPQVMKNWSLRNEKQSEPYEYPRILQIKSIWAVLEGGEPMQGSTVSLSRA